MSTTRKKTTRSTCIPVTEHGTHQFEISGYSLLKGTGSSNTSIKSGTFSVGGYDWAIRFLPNQGGDDGSTHRFISIFLVLFSKGACKVRASCDLGLVDHTTGLPSWKHRTTEPREFSYGERSMYFPQTGFMSHAEFEESPYLRDDSFTIHCDVTVVKEPQVFTNMFLNEIKVPPRDITEHLGKLLGTGAGSDVTFILDGEVIAAHKIMLAARSPVFMAEFYGPMKEAKAEHVAIEDMPADVFRAFLHFIYTDSLPNTDDIRGDVDNNLIKHLLVAADRYDVGRLKVMCESMICDSLGVGNVVDTLPLAYRHNCPRLKDCCLDLINRPGVVRAVKETLTYKDLKRKFPEIFADAFEFRKMNWHLLYHGSASLAAFLETQSIEYCPSLYSDQ